MAITTHMSLGNCPFECLLPASFLKNLFDEPRQGVTLCSFSPYLFALAGILYLGRAWDEYWRGAGVRSQQYEFLR